MLNYMDVALGNGINWFEEQSVEKKIAGWI